MRSKRNFGLRFAALGAAAIAGLALWGANGRAASNSYIQTDLVSDNGVPGTHKDPLLSNAWGLVQPPGGPFWINDNNTGVSELYNGKGVPFAGLPFVKVPPPSKGKPPSTPTGIVWSSGGFKGDAFIFDTEDGTISGWQGGPSAIIRVDNPSFPNGAVYKGLAIASLKGSNFIYATNFRTAKVDVFDTNYHPVPLDAGDFVNPTLPAGYAPFGIATIDGNLWVTYALQNSLKHDPVHGPHLGYVDEFTPEGDMVERFASQGPLNAPWGLAVAPANFGQFSGDVLVGNFGDGRINVYKTNKTFEGQMMGPCGPLDIDGLWALDFGNGAESAPTNTLYFTAGPMGETHGLFGTIIADDE